MLDARLIGPMTIACVAALTVGSASHAADTLFECTALRDEIGRIDPDPASDLMRWEDGGLRAMEKGSVAFTSDDPKASDWLLMFATPGGHGSSMYGYITRKSVSCTPSSDN